MKSIFVLLFLYSIASFSLVACARAGSVSSDSSSSSTQTGNAVHLTATQFVQASIMIHKGERLTLINDSDAPHIIANGTWKNDATQMVKEPGAPQVSAVQVASNSTVSIGPFNTDGTFHLYCTIHQNMNLTIVVR